MVSIIIPARNEVYLEKTIRNVLENADGEIEVLVMLDGYTPTPEINIGDTRVTFYHYKDPIGQRQCVNAGVKLAKGKYVMKLDAHCALDKGFDTKLSNDCEYSWTVIPRMYNLDINTWTPKLHKRTDYMYISSPDSDRPFRASYYEKGLKQPDNDKEIDDIMCCMGCCFFMHKDRFLEQDGCDEGHGGWGQQGVEVSLKAWLSGGALKVNKKTWFSHWFRGDVGFPYEISFTAQEKAREYSQNIWLNGKWDKAVKNIQWVTDKFNPPGWDKKKTHYPRWRGNKVIKYPTDLLLYHQVIWENKPDTIIECGTAYGGSTLFFADMLDMVRKGKVISIDINPVAQPKHHRIEYLTGRTTSTEILEEVKKRINGKCMVILDSDHSRVHVKRELHYYSPLVTRGQYMVVEDGWHKGTKKPPLEAIEWFIPRSNGKFVITDIDKQFVDTLTRGGWLKRI